MCMLQNSILSMQDNSNYQTGKSFLHHNTVVPEVLSFQLELRGKFESVATMQIVYAKLQLMAKFCCVLEILIRQDGVSC